MAEFGEHRRRKVMTFFKRFDKDGNGVLMEKDFRLVAQNIITVGNFTGARGNEIRTQYLEMWNKYYQPLAKNGEVSIPEMVDYIKNINKAEARAMSAEQLDLFFDIIDTNQDGYIQLGEYATAFNIAGIGEEFAKPAFEALDTNHDGLLSRDEFVSAGLDFLFLEEPSHPADLFFGPLE